jgi:hypothetical protein
MKLEPLLDALNQIHEANGNVEVIFAHGDGRTYTDELRMNLESDKDPIPEEKGTRLWGTGLFWKKA